MTSTTIQPENFKAALAKFRLSENWKYTSLSRLSSFTPRLSSSPLSQAELEKAFTLRNEIFKKIGIQESEVQNEWNVLVLADARVLEQACTFRKEDIEVSQSSVPNDSKMKSEYAELSELSTDTKHCTARLKKRVGKTAGFEMPIKLLIIDACGIQAGNNTANLILDIQVDERSAADLLFVSLNSSLAPSLSVQNISITINSASHLRFFLAQEVCIDSVLLSQIHCSVAANSRLDLLGASRTNGLIRNDLEINLENPGAESEFRSFYLPYHSGHIDNHTVVRHVTNNTTSAQLYKGLVFDKGRAVFNGKVIIEKGADGSSAGQLNRTILMGDGARVDTKPELQIHADEVSCSHGASVGPLSEDEIFYLQSRCLTREQAVSLIGAGFVAELVQTEAFKAPYFQQAFEAWTDYPQAE